MKRGTLLWDERKRWCGLPLTFTTYACTTERLFRRKGLISVTEDQVNLYQVRDVTVKVTLWQRLCRVGTITVFSTDKSDPILKLENICEPYDVRDVIMEAVEDACRDRGVRYTEFVNTAEHDCDHH